MDHSHTRSSNAFTVRREEYSQNPNGLSYFNGSKPRKKGPMRPSMELRHRQLDLSLLQVCSSLQLHAWPPQADALLLLNCCGFCSAGLPYPQLNAWPTQADAALLPRQAGGSSTFSVWG